MLFRSGQDETLIQQFLTEVDIGYAEILKELEKDEVDLMLLSKQYQQVYKKDYFQSELGTQVRQALMSDRER